MERVQVSTSVDLVMVDSNVAISEAANGETSKGHHAAKRQRGSEIAPAWCQLCYRAATCFFCTSLLSKGVH